MDTARSDSTSFNPLLRLVHNTYVGALRSSLLLEAKSFIDRAASAVRYSLARDVHPDDWRRIAAELSSACSLWKRHGWFTKPADYHRTPPPLDHLRLRRQSNFRGTDFFHLKFESQYSPWPEEPGAERWSSYERNRSAHAWVLRHRGRSRPWLICVHGYGCGIPFFDFEAFRAAWLHQTLGLNVVMPVLPLHGPRCQSWRSGEGFFNGDVLDTLHAEAQAVWDIRRILSWVRTQDPTAVGIYGLSLGGYTAALLASLEADLSCVIAGIPATDFVRLAKLHNSPTSMRMAEECGLDWDAIELLYRPISPLSLQPLVPHPRRYIFAGRGDCIVPADHVKDLCSHWDNPQTAWYDGSHFSFLWESTVREFLHEAIRTTLQSPLTVADDQPLAAVG